MDSVIIFIDVSYLSCKSGGGGALIYYTMALWRFLIQKEKDDKTLNVNLDESLKKLSL